MKIEYNNSTKRFSVSRKEVVESGEIEFEIDDLINKIYELINDKIDNCKDDHELPYLNILKDKIYDAIDEYVKETDGKPVETDYEDEE